MTFKDALAADIHTVFLNPEEFSDLHNVNGVDMPIQIDANEQIEREKRFSQHIDGIYSDEILIYVAAADFGPLPAQGSYITLDGARYRVADAIEEDGVYSLTISAATPVTYHAQVRQRGLPGGLIGGRP